MALGDIISNHNETLRLHDSIPIEGVGVVHVVTQATEDDLEYAYSDVTLIRYEHGQPAEHVPVAGSVCEKMVARCMHEHWCDLERLTRCVRGDVQALFIGDIDFELEDDEDEEVEVNATPNPYEVHPDWSFRVKAIYARAERRPVRAPTALKSDEECTSTA
jgi:hypothetical protein